LNIYNALIKSSLFYGAETWRLTENNKRRVEATEMDCLRRSSRISRKDRIRNSEAKGQTICYKGSSFIASTCFGHQYAHHQ
jgi:hypothetical protein